MSKYTKTRKKYKHLNIEEREEISIGLESGKTLESIASSISRHKSTLSREIQRNAPMIRAVKYRANRAQMRYDNRKQESHTRERLKSRRIRSYAGKKIKAGWSPEQVAGRLPIDHPGHSTNYESIYQWIYTERRDLISYLTLGRKKRKKRGKLRNKRSIKVPNRVMIDQRPAEVGERKEIGHWETDTAVSRQSKAAVAFVIERMMRYCRIKKLSAKTANNMSSAIIKSIGNLPKSLRKTLTYDNGTENALHERTSKELDMKSYFCHPYHSWEKGSVENCIGLLRRVFPKKTNWSLISQKDLDRVEKMLNTRPRKCLGFKTPEEVFVALTH